MRHGKEKQKEWEYGNIFGAFGVAKRDLVRKWTYDTAYRNVLAGEMVGGGH